MKLKMTLKVLKLNFKSEAVSQENNFYHLENVKSAGKGLTFCLLHLIISRNSVWNVHRQLKLCATEVQKSILNLAIGVVLLLVIILWNVEIKTHVLAAMEIRIIPLALALLAIKVFCVLIVL